MSLTRIYVDALVIRNTAAAAVAQYGAASMVARSLTFHDGDQQDPQFVVRSIMWRTFRELHLFVSGGCDGLTTQTQ